MRFAFVSTEGLSLSWWARLLAEGHEVRVWIKEPDFRSVGEGIVDRADSLDALLRWGRQDERTVFVFDLTGFGKIADQLRSRGARVLGASEIGDRLEERTYGLKVASLLGIRIPETHAFASISEAEASEVLRSSRGARWFWKPTKKGLPSETTYGAKDREDLLRMLRYLRKTYGDMPGVLQKRIDGVVIDTAWWWNGTDIIGYMALLEYKKAYTSDLGPNTGAATSLMWAYESDEPRVAALLRAKDIAELFRRLELPPGEYDVNGVISERDEKLYYLEWGPRFGWDADAVYLQGLTRPLGDVLAELAAGTLTELPFRRGEYWGGVHVGVPPYPFAGDVARKESPVGLPVGAIPDIIGERFGAFGVGRRDGQLIVAAPDGNVGVALGKGPTVEKACASVYATTKEIEIPHAWWRTDFGEHERKDIARLTSMGFEVR